MKNIMIIAFAAILFTAESAFAQKKETRNVGSFSKISFGVPGKLYLRQGNDEKVELEGDADVLERVETIVSGTHLDIRPKGKMINWNWGGKQITAYVTMKNIEGISVSGSGDIVGEGIFNAGDLDLNVSGSGNLTVQANASGNMDADISGSGNLSVKGKGRSLDSSLSGSGTLALSLAVANDVSFNISGSGKIDASGSSQRVKVSISGSGKIRAADFDTKICNIKIAGSGDVEIGVQDELDANISGSGSVTYRGNPGKINSHSAGSGKVRKM
ncbi:MAG TPA: head GIN domain-containing protein [Cyclobacteriaceae bacterium]|nr:head GIN domain-containing protein [Cyclobacteriaceae bacterium]